MRDFINIPKNHPLVFHVCKLLFLCIRISLSPSTPVDTKGLRKERGEKKSYCLGMLGYVWSLKIFNILSMREEHVFSLNLIRLQKSHRSKKKTTVFFVDTARLPCLIKGPFSCIC